MSLAGEIMRPPLSYNEHDHLGFMTLGFVSKQMEHLKSVCLLVDAGRDRDAGLIARSMVEGMGWLLWAALQPAERPLRWRSYAWVEDWRLLRKKEQAGEHIEASRKAEIDAQLKRFGQQFYTDKAKKLSGMGQSLPSDPYRRDWAGTSVRAVLEEVDRLPLYELIYRRISGWIHWGPGAMGTAIERDQSNVVYAEEDPGIAATALAVGFQALFESVSALDNHFARGFADRLAELSDAYIAELGNP
jgi:hypothetical protein